jgi:DNA polymerase-3 subunit delta'
MISEENFLGNEKKVGYLNRILDKRLISHAYLFEGPEHIGKTTLALRFAAEILGDSFENVLNNPDLIFVSASEDEKQIGVETIRDLQKNLSLYPYKAKYKIALIEKAELMNRTAANSLLKTLEEPGQTSILILVSSDSGKLLDTIKSRCQILNFGVAPEAALEKFLSRQNENISLKDIEDILELSQGKAGIAVNMLKDSEFLRKTKEEKNEILNFFNIKNFKKLENAALVYQMEKEEVIDTLDLWIWTLRVELLKSFNEQNEAEILHMRKMKNAIEKITSVKEDISDRNVNVRLAIENLCLGF